MPRPAAFLAIVGRPPDFKGRRCCTRRRGPHALDPRRPGHASSPDPERRPRLADTPVSVSDGGTEPLSHGFYGCGKIRGGCVEIIGKSGRNVQRVGGKNQWFFRGASTSFF